MCLKYQGEDFMKDKLKNMSKKKNKRKTNWPMKIMGIFMLLLMRKEIIIMKKKLCKCFVFRKKECNFAVHFG